MHATLAAATQTLLADAGRGRQTLRKGRGCTRQINTFHDNHHHQPGHRKKKKTANRQAPSGPISADGPIDQHKCRARLL